MIFKDALKKALEIIGDEDIDLDTTEAPTGKLKKLISCGNMIYGELTEEYVFLRRSEEITVTDGKINLDDLSKPLKEVVRIKYGERNLPYRLFPGYIRLGGLNGVKCTVVYTYHAEELALTDEMVLPTSFTAGAIATGIASEYFYRSGLIDEALFYKNRYDNTVLNLTKKRNPAVVCYRRFI
ncbi:MAG: hypothetical protein ACI4SK_06610 [Christensenellales bacterium]